MAEWLYEKGLGENRALLLDGGRAVEAHLEVFPAPLQPGDVLSMRVIEIQVQGRRGIVRLSAPGDAPDTNPDFEAILEPLPERTSLKSEVLVEIVREPIFDGRVHKRTKARPAAPDAIPGGASALRDRIEATDHPIRTVDPHGPDLLEEAGLLRATWFVAGLIRISGTLIILAGMVLALAYAVPKPSRAHNPPSWRNAYEDKWRR